MGRKVKEVSIADENRDKGKVFVITEMDAWQAEEWALRAFLALAAGGVEIPDEVRDMGMAGMAVVGLRSLRGVEFGDAKALMDEMFSCVKIAPDPKNHSVIRELLPDDTEEVKTRLLLRSEVFELHTGFSIAGELSKLSISGSTPAPSSDTPTRQASSAS